MGGLFLFCGNAVLLSVSGIYDIRYKRIPNIITLGMLAFLSVFHAVNVMLTGISPDAMQVIGSLAGAAAPFFLMLPAEVLTKKSFGAGDKKALAVLGLGTGVWGIVAIIFCMLAGALIFGIARKQGRKETIAMAPFILAGYIIFFIFKM